MIRTYFTVIINISGICLCRNQVHSNNTRTNNQMSILLVNRSKTKYCVLHNGMITWNSLPEKNDGN